MGNISDVVIKFLPESVKTPEIIGGIEKYAPKVIFVTGAATTTFGSVWLAKRAAEKGPIIKKGIDKLSIEKAKLVSTGMNDDFARELYFSNRNEIVKDTVKEAAKVYGPPAACVIGGQVLEAVAFGTVTGQLATATASLGAAYATLNKISKRTENMLGKETRDAIFYNADPKVIKKASVDENGNAVVEDKTILVSDDITKIPWTLNFSKARKYRPNDPMWNTGIISYAECNLIATVKDRIYRNGIGYISFYEIAEALSIPIEKGEMVKSMTYGKVFNDLSDIEAGCIFTRPSEIYQDFTTDGYPYQEVVDYIVDCGEMVNIYEYLKGK